MKTISAVWSSWGPIPQLRTFSQALFVTNYFGLRENLRVSATDWLKVYDDLKWEGGGGGQQNINEKYLSVSLSKWPHLDATSPPLDKCQQLVGGLVHHPTLAIHPPPLLPECFGRIDRWPAMPLTFSLAASSVYLFQPKIFPIRSQHLKLTIKVTKDMLSTVWPCQLLCFPGNCPRFGSTAGFQIHSSPQLAQNLIRTPSQPN